MISFEQIDQIYDWQKSLTSGQVEYVHGEMSKAAPLMQEGVLKKLVGDPILRRYVGYLTGSDMPRNTLGWQAQGERLMRMWEVMCVPSPVDFGVGEHAEGRHMATAMSLLLSQVYLWKDSIFEAAGQTPVPKHIISRHVLPHPVMFWSLETAHKWPDGIHETNFLIVRDEGDGLSCMGDCSEPGVGWRPYRFELSYGSVFPDDVPEEGRVGVAGLLGCLAFLNSNYIEAVKEGLPRSIRRSKEFQSSPRPEEYETTVIQLRRRVPDRQQADQEGKPRDWRHQWWVSGHIRAQWYPSEKAHKLIWIAPYLKGPDDKPILTKTYAVAR